MSRTRNRHKKTAPKVLDVSLQELFAIVERSRTGPLDAEDQCKLKTSITTLGFLMEELRRKATSIKRLRALLFGAKTEKTSQLLDEPQATKNAQAGDGKPDSGAKREGHGRNGAAAAVKVGEFRKRDLEESRSERFHDFPEISSL